MDALKIKKLLEDFQKGKTNLSETLDFLKKLPFEDLDFAKIDHHRSLRNGFPEVIWAPGKTVEQIIGIVERLNGGTSPVLVTRVSPETADQLTSRFPQGKYLSSPRLFVLEKERPLVKTKGAILVVSAGTSDIPVAEEAYWTAHYMGNEAARIYDVGIAGLHRLLAHIDQIQQASVIVVVAGMEGALPSVVAGLAGKPVIGVPTSVGYGVTLGGITPLMTMLASCASGLTVVNIDNGFGAAYAASLINRIE